MLEVDFFEQDKIIVVKPLSSLDKTDFLNLREKINSFLETYVHINGLIIHTETFPGWDSFSALIKHLEFIKDYHKTLSHIALVTDSKIGTFAEDFANHFINAEIKKFDYNEINEAYQWIKSSS